jgi:hypothetical protein
VHAAEEADGGHIGAGVAQRDGLYRKALRPHLHVAQLTNADVRACVI